MAVAVAVGTCARLSIEWLVYEVTVKADAEVFSCLDCISKNA